MHTVWKSTIFTEESTFFRQINVFTKEVIAFYCTFPHCFDVKIAQICSSLLFNKYSVKVLFNWYYAMMLNTISQILFPFFFLRHLPIWKCLKFTKCAKFYRPLRGCKTNFLLFRISFKTKTKWNKVKSKEKARRLMSALQRTAAENSQECANFKISE